mmetsp:Transcript_23988/g.53675  ORF Transcript_23988/g.53675 Transcript_23988/m.53675 type:complete len:85 (-) Transcript_23988:1940-2194(-)
MAISLRCPSRSRGKPREEGFDPSQTERRLNDLNPKSGDVAERRAKPTYPIILPNDLIVDICYANIDLVGFVLANLILIYSMVKY